MAKNVTMRDVATHAGVSIATVSHVINKTRHVNQQTRETVISAINSLGYTVSVSVASKKDGNNFIGLIIADIREDYYTEIVKAAEGTARENGFSLILCDAEDDKEKELFYIKMLLSQNVQGIVLAPINRNEPPPLLGSIDIPIVQIDRRYQDQPYDFVGIDNFAAGREAALNLIRQGASRIGFVGYGDTVYTIRERILGCRDAIDLSGLKNDLQVLRMKYHAGGAGDQIYSMVEEYNLDGLICGTSHACYETVTSLKEHGVDVSNDLKIITFDENKWFEFISIPLSVVQQPTEEIGALSVEFIINKIRNPQSKKRDPRTVLLNTSIINR